MNAIDYAIKQIRNGIPKEILEKTFLSNVNYRTVIPISVDSVIKEQVIYGRVFDDINILGGVEVSIPLDGIPYEVIDSNSIVFRIPKNRTQGRSITATYSVAFGGSSNIAYTVNSQYGAGGDLAQAYQQMLSAVSSIPYISEAQCHLVGDNVVLLEGAIGHTSGLYLRCMLENDSNLTNLKRPAFLAFGELCVLATKAHVYNTNVIPMDIGYIEGGANMGKMQDIIDSYSDSEEQYLEMLKKRWAKVSKLNNYETAQRFVRWTTGGAY